MGSSENSGVIQFIPDCELTFDCKIAAQLDCSTDEFLNEAVDVLGGEDTAPKSKLKTAPEFFGAEFVVAVLTRCD
jgi:hypothetical protein